MARNRTNSPSLFVYLLTISFRATHFIQPIEITLEKKSIHRNMHIICIAYRHRRGSASSRVLKTFREVAHQDVHTQRLFKKRCLCIQFLRTHFLLKFIEWPVAPSRSSRSWWSSAPSQNPRTNCVSELSNCTHCIQCVCRAFNPLLLLWPLHSNAAGTYLANTSVTPSGPLLVAEPAESVCAPRLRLHQERRFASARTFRFFVKCAAQISPWWKRCAPVCSR